MNTHQRILQYFFLFYVLIYWQNQMQWHSLSVWSADSGKQLALPNNIDVTSKMLYLENVEFKNFS